jgi:hypothetical protein
MYQPPQDSFPKADDPENPVDHKFMKSKQSHYEREGKREQRFSSEIIVWRLQKDMIELF